ncbi:hypothetical protein BN1723_001638 [Verticillium longisporum]|uniref:Zn(2)-C6 fungal-type domain-containing protein n=1 Tax=Verticillium longisporum TaxID=100787 RepID=A0A0G4M7I7_VERLO|nr:hypothetical protein BN1723_001638 [Verticillium longisporum]CRK30259.1 hypothetical protein BN1708_000794 [Verticillium longisporum]
MTRSLARRNDGCYECCKRRLRCDKTEPSCLKCQKKGIQCSGQGLRCRFSSHMAPATSPASRAKKKSASRTSQSPVPSNPSSSSSTPFTASSPSTLGSLLDPASQETMALVPVHASTLDPASFSSLARRDFMPLRAAPDEPLHPQARMLMSHFCDHIAPVMVVLDFAGNGYRDVILPLAMQDDVLRRAISVVAAFHLAQKAPHLQQTALAGHQAIVQKLRRDSLMLRPDQLFTPYTWATIVVLLVGETITGADNFAYLLEMLTCLRQSPEAIAALPLALRDFFVQQVKMFELFGFPLSNETKGLDVLQEPPDNYMDFIAYPSLSPGSELQSNVQIMRGAIRDACELYRRRALSSPSTEDSVPLVEWLRQRVLPLDAHTPGAHALVWPYFVAAAESSLPEHREFFSGRLKDLHQFTGFGSITTALQALETIWAMQGIKRWTEIMSKDFHVLVM